MLEHIGDIDADEAQGLLPMAAWQPNGRNIYCVQSMGPKTRICIFERNGLGHGSFIVSNEQDLEISQLAWSPDSTVLAITGTSQVPNPNLPTYIRLLHLLFSHDSRCLWLVSSLVRLV